MIVTTNDMNTLVTPPPPPLHKSGRAVLHFVSIINLVFQQIIKPLESSLLHKQPLLSVAISHKRPSDRPHGQRKQSFAMPAFASRRLCEGEKRGSFILAFRATIRFSAPGGG